MSSFLNNLDQNPQDYLMAKSPVTTLMGKKLVPASPEWKSSTMIPKIAEIEGPGFIPELNTANIILKTLKEKSKTLNELDVLTRKAFMKNATNETPEKIVASVFRPGAAADIKYLKLSLKPYKKINKITGLEETIDLFPLVQENAMGQLLSDAVSVGKLKSSAKLSDIFKPNNLRSALESYGDDTLEAMFGKEQLFALKGLQQSLDLQVGAAQGLTAGGIVAGAIGAQALNISLMPTILGLKVFANVMSRPSIVKLLANTDTSSTMIVIDAFEKAARLTFAQSIQEGSGQIESGIMQELRKQIESPDNQAAAEELKGQVEQIAKPLKTAIPDLPEMLPVNLGAQNQAPISRSLLGGNPANEGIAESLGRLA